MFSKAGVQSHGVRRPVSVYLFQIANMSISLYTLTNKYFILLLSYNMSWS